MTCGRGYTWEPVMFSVPESESTNENPSSRVTLNFPKPAPNLNESKQKQHGICCLFTTTSKMEKIYALVQWEDMIVTVIDAEGIITPRKDIKDYSGGDLITARFPAYRGHVYKAVISEISHDKSMLEKKKKEPLKHTYENTIDSGNSDTTEIPASTADTQSSKSNKKTRRANRHVSSEKGTSKKAVSLPAAPATSKTSDRVTTNRAQAIKKAMLNLIESEEEDSIEANDNTSDKSECEESQSLLAEYIARPTKQTGNSIARKIALLEMDSDSSEDIDEPQTKNPKGHPTIAVKQPRQRTATTPASLTTPEEESIKVTETLHCVNCFVLEARIKFLENQLKECAQITGPVTESCALPKPGLLSETEAVKHKMVKLVDGHHIYLFEHQKMQCLKKGADPKKPGQRDGKRMGRYLLTVFFSKEQRLAGTFSNSNTKYQRLCPKIESAIVDFCAAYSASSKGEIRDAMYSSITSLRASKIRKTTVVNIY